MKNKTIFPPTGPYLFGMLISNGTTTFAALNHFLSVQTVQVQLGAVRASGTEFSPRIRLDILFSMFRHEQSKLMLCSEPD